MKQIVRITFDSDTGDVKLESEIDTPIILLGVLEFVQGMVSHRVHGQPQPSIVPASAVGPVRRG